MEKIIVIKIGGIASQHLSADFTEQLKQWQIQGYGIVVVHGGGFAINQLMADAKLPIKKIDGLRVTTKAAMDLVTEALFEQVGRSLADKLCQAGIDCLQISHHLKDILIADYLNRERYGYVGDIKQVDTPFLQRVLSEGMIPLLASVGYTTDNQALNVNADYVATAVAVALKAECLILMTDVKGVLENKHVLDEIDLEQIDEKIRNGIITGGMIPKLTSAKKTIQAGVNQVMIGNDLQIGTIIVERRGKI